MGLELVLELVAKSVKMKYRKNLTFLCESDFLEKWKIRTFSHVIMKYFFLV